MPPRLSKGPLKLECVYRHKQRTVNTGLTPSDAARVIRSLAGEPQVTVVVSGKGTDTILLAITGFSAFLSLERPGELYDYLAEDGGRGGTVPFRIENHEHDIPSRYVVDIDTASSAVLEWLETDGEPSPDAWERRGTSRLGEIQRMTRLPHP